MKRATGIFIIAAAVGLLVCGTAFAAINGCTVISQTNIYDPADTAFNTMMNTCSEITLEDTLRIDHRNGLIIPGDKTFIFSNTSGKHGKIEANAMTILGNVTVKLAPMENSVLTGAWGTKDSLKNSPYELIRITNTNGYIDVSQFSLFKEYKADGIWTKFWNSGYKLDKKTDPDNGKLKDIVLTYAAPAPAPISGDTSADVDDGGGGCHIGWSIFVILGIGLVVCKSGIGTPGSRQIGE